MTAATSGESSSRYTRQIVTARKVWASDKLFSLRVTRDTSFGFVPGQFARLGLPLPYPAASGEAKAASVDVPTEWRAYSMVSHPDEAELEFYCVTVEHGKFSPALANLNPGDSLFIDKSVFGFLTLDRFAEGEDLWLICTGTGLSAYLSMLRDDATWLKFKHIVLVHGVRYANELAYRDELLNMLGLHANFTYLPVTSQEVASPSLSPSLKNQNNLQATRLTSLLKQGGLEARAKNMLNPERSRVMLCGNPEMVTEMRALLAAQGFAPGRRGIPGNLAVENYW
jgi:ferredoxin--NADP+ reductase